MTDTSTERDDEGAWARLRHRKVVQWGLAYATGAWALLQVVGFAVDTFDWPRQIQQFASIGLAVGLPVVLVVAWFHGDRGQQRVSGAELVILSALLALGGGALWLYGQRDGQVPAASSPPAAPTASQGAPAATADERPSIAVLPFANRSARADDAYFAEGMHDDLLGQLSRIRDVRVVSRTSVMRYSGTQKPIPDIATELGVGVILEGGVQRAGDRVRVNVQLIDGRTDTHLWSETFDRELTVANLFDIQSEITQAIATELKSVMSGRAKLRPEELPTQSTEAYNAYLLGNSLYRWDEVDLDRMRGAAQAYGEAVAIDPKFAEAYARKAVAHSTLFRWGVDVAENARLAEQALERARSLAPLSSETLAAEGLHRYWVKNDYAGADAAARAALEQSPQDARLWRLRGGVARRSGDLAASTAAFERVLATDPKDAHAVADVGINQSLLGRLSDARRSLSRAWALAPDSNYNSALESAIMGLSGDVDANWRRYEELRGQAGLNPTYVDLAFSDVNTLRDPARLEALATRLGDEQGSGTIGSLGAFFRAVALDRLGRRAEALAEAQALKAQLAVGASTVNADGSGVTKTLAVALDAFLGDTAAAQAGAAALKKDPPRDRTWVVTLAPLLLIDAYARLGQPEAAFDLVEQGMDEFSPIHFVNMKNNVAFDAYRELPRYRALNARYEAWKAAQPPAG